MMPSRTVTRLTVALTILSAAIGHAEQQERPTFRSAARLVEVSIVVTDRDRNPVTGLTANDFQILDEGKPQKAALF